MRQIKKTIFGSNFGLRSCKPKSIFKNVIKMESVLGFREHEKLVLAKNVFSLAYDGGSSITYLIYERLNSMGAIVSTVKRWVLLPGKWKSLGSRVIAWLVANTSEITSTIFSRCPMKQTASTFQNSLRLNCRNRATMHGVRNSGYRRS